MMPCDGLFHALHVRLRQTRPRQSKPLHPVSPDGPTDPPLARFIRHAHRASASAASENGQSDSMRGDLPGNAVSRSCSACAQGLSRMGSRDGSLRAWAGPSTLPLGRRAAACPCGQPRSIVPDVAVGEGLREDRPWRLRGEQPESVTRRARRVARHCSTHGLLRWMSCAPCSPYSCFDSQS